jgi:hypothetical protein
MLKRECSSHDYQKKKHTAVFLKQNWRKCKTKMRAWKFNQQRLRILDHLIDLQYTQGICSRERGKT